MEISERIKNSIHNLPTLPTIFSQLSDALSDPNVTNKEISRLISSDQSTAIKILKVVNSSLFGLSGKINSISAALMQLGHNEVRNIVFSLSVMNVLSSKQKIRGFNPTELWVHSIGVGVVSRNLGSNAGEIGIENFFLAGIFHDIGKIIFIILEPEEYQKVIELVNNKKCTVTDAELEIFGIDHSEAGFIIAEKWNLPLNIQEAILLHHDGRKSQGTSALLAAVHLGNIIAHALNFGFSGSNIIEKPYSDVWDLLKIKPGTLSYLTPRFVDDFKNTSSLIIN